MAKLLLALLLLLPAAALPGAGEIPRPLIRAVDLDADMLQKNPALAAADTLSLRVEADREAPYKVSEQGAMLADGQLLPGSNSLQVTRSGLFARSQSLIFLLEWLENDVVFQKKLTISVSVEGEPEMETRETAGLSGSFTLEMYHAGHLIGFRKKSMGALLNLKTGLVVPMPDPGISNAAGRNPSAGQSVSLLGLGMALAKYLSGKKAKKRIQAHAAELQKKKLKLVIIRPGKNGEKREVPIVVELRVE
jgi:hypothetical protein